MKLSLSNIFNFCNYACHVLCQVVLPPTYTTDNISHMCALSETFEVDISNTKKLLEGERGQLICQKDIIVSASCLDEWWQLI